MKIKVGICISFHERTSIQTPMHELFFPEKMLHLF